MWLRTNKFYDIFFFLRFILRGAERDFSNLSSLKSLMSCLKQHFIFITKVETGVAVQNQNISVELYPHVDKMTQFFDVFASIDRDKNPSLSFVSITFCCASCGGGWGEGV